MLVGNCCKKSKLHGHVHQFFTVSKPLISLLDHDVFLKRICERLDSPLPGGHDYRVVAQHFGFDYYKIRSVFEKDAQGPSYAMICLLVSQQPRLTVEKFAWVVEEKANRQDVVELLREYDSWSNDAQETD